MKKITRFQTADGREFESANEAKAHGQFLDFRAALDALLAGESTEGSIAEALWQQYTIKPKGSTK